MRILLLQIERLRHYEYLKKQTNTIPPKKKSLVEFTKEVAEKNNIRDSSIINDDNRQLFRHLFRV